MCIRDSVVGDATEVEVRLSDKTKLFAQVVGKDPDTDTRLRWMAATMAASPTLPWNCT